MCKYVKYLWKLKGFVDVINRVLCRKHALEQQLKSLSCHDIVQLEMHPALKFIGHESYSETSLPDDNVKVHSWISCLDCLFALCQKLKTENVNN